MENDASTLQNALAVLHKQYGNLLTGPKQQSEVKLRHTLQQQLKVNDVTADRILTKLVQLGRLVYVGATMHGYESGTNTTGPVISMPGTSTSGGGEIISTASPDQLMGRGNAVRGLEEEDEPDMFGNREEDQGDH